MKHLRKSVWLFYVLLPFTEDRVLKEIQEPAKKGLFVTPFISEYSKKKNYIIAFIDCMQNVCRKNCWEESW